MRISIEIIIKCANLMKAANQVHVSVATLHNEIKELLGEDSWDFSKYGFQCSLDECGDHSVVPFSYCHSKECGKMTLVDLSTVTKILSQEPENRERLFQKPASILLLESVTGVQASLRGPLFVRWNIACETIDISNNPFQLSDGHSKSELHFEVCFRHSDESSDCSEEHESLKNIPLERLLTILEQEGAITRRCARCETFHTRLFACSGLCGEHSLRVYYCSKQCQKLHWAIHKSICGKSVK